MNALAHAAPNARPPIVVVGAGPVGVRFVQRLLARQPEAQVALFGREPWDPYNRVQLSTFLTGETKWHDLGAGLELPQAPHLQLHAHQEIVAVDTAGRCVEDAHGQWHPYERLVLATGSRARVPELPGIGQAHVYVFRDLADAQALLARRARSVHTVVLGGGLLGLEAARAMQRMHTRVTVLEHGARLMGRQLDEAGAACLRRRVEAMGIGVRTDAAVKAIRGHGSVAGVELRGGEVIACDTVVVATGIRPNVELALAAGIKVGRGIRVDDSMTTSDPHVLAIGECCEHRERVYGVVAPGLEQAGVAVHTVLGGSARYTGSLVSTRLKVVGLPVFSIGSIDDEQSHEALRTLVHDSAQGQHRAITLARGRLAGAVAVGDGGDLNRLQEAVLAQRRVWPWQALRWVRQGSLWPPQEEASVVAWPADAMVCQCNQVSRGELGLALARGCNTLACLARETRASTVCGACKPLLIELVAHAGQAPVTMAPVRGWLGLGTSAGVGALLALLLLLLPGLLYWQSVQGAVAWQRIWTDTLWKQLSGYAVIALSALGLLLSLRKRVRRISQGDFDLWRVAHVALGVAALLGLLVHTGARLGHNMDFWLMLSFVGLALVGGLSAGVIAWGHRLQPALVRRWRAQSVWVHILLFWPVPALLAFHILKSYWFGG